MSGFFDYPPRSNGSVVSENYGYSWQDTVMATWTSTITNSTPCQLSLYFWLDTGRQPWTSCEYPIKLVELMITVQPAGSMSLAQARGPCC